MDGYESDGGKRKRRSVYTKTSKKVKIGSQERTLYLNQNKTEYVILNGKYVTVFKAKQMAKPKHKH